MDVADAFSKQVQRLDDLIGKATKAVGLEAKTEGRGENEIKALVAVRRYTALSFVGGMIPFSFVDLVAVSSAQLSMVAEIARIYGVPFDKDKVKIIVSALLGSVVPQGLAAGVAGSAVKSIPIVGQIAGMALMPTFSASFAYALGKVFIEHFEAGGTLLDLDPVALKAYFVSQFEGHAKAVAPEAEAAVAVAAEGEAPASEAVPAEKAPAAPTA